MTKEEFYLKHRWMVEYACRSIFRIVQVQDSDEYQDGCLGLMSVYGKWQSDRPGAQSYLHKIIRQYIVNGRNYRAGKTTTAKHNSPQYIHHVKRAWRPILSEADLRKDPVNSPTLASTVRDEHNDFIMVDNRLDAASIMCRVGKYLTTRQHLVLRAVFNGFEQKEVASTLGVSCQAISALYIKGVNNIRGALSLPQLTQRKTI